MTVTEFLEKWGRTLFEAPLAIPSKHDEPPELAEIRLALLDQVRTKSYRAGGKKVFPFDLMRVSLCGVEKSRAAAFSGRFFRQYLEQELRGALRNAECRFPETLRVEVETTSVLPRPGEEWMRIETGSQQPVDPGASRRARLVVLEGNANVADLPLDKPRINIGRTVDVYRADGLLRRNDLVFAEDTEINRTVSREHAHISFDPVGDEYRLHNDRWYPLDSKGGGNSATWLVRNGLSEAVHRGTRGTRLEDGDEILFGRASVRFHLK